MITSSEICGCSCMVNDSISGSGSDCACSFFGRTKNVVIDLFPFFEASFLAKDVDGFDAFLAVVVGNFGTGADVVRGKFGGSAAAGDDTSTASNTAISGK